MTNSVAVGGMEEHVYLLAKHLDRSAFEVTAIVPESEAIAPFVRKLQGAADRVEIVTADRRYGVAKQGTELMRLTQLLRSAEIDVIHLHSTTYTGMATARWCARLGGVRSVYITEHLAPDAPLGSFSRLRRDRFSQSITGVVCVSEKNRLARSAHLLTPQDRTIVVPNGVDVADFDHVDASEVAAVRQALDIPVDAPVVGTVVRLEPEKGLDDLLDAFVLVHREHPDAHLLFVGDGSLRHELEARATALGFGSVTRFAGFQRDPKPYLANIDAFVLPVPVGSMSIGLLEAMALRRAVVITFGGEGEAVLHGETGYAATRVNPASIAEHVNAILADPDLRDALGKAARVRVEEAFSAQRVAETLGDLYRYGPDVARTRGVVIE